MDLLSQYRQDHPESFRGEPQGQPAERDFLISLVMKLSGGRIQEKQHAVFVLLAIAIISFLVSIFILIELIGGSGDEVSVDPLTDPTLSDNPKGL